MVKKICIPLIILMSLFLSVICWNDYKKSEQTHKLNEQMNKEQVPLRVELEDLKQELEEGERSYKKEVKGSGTINFLFTNVREEVFSKAWPKLQKYGFKGMIVLAEGDLPGMGGNMSMGQFQALMAAGWSWCIGWPDGSSHPEEVYQRMMEWTGKAGIGQPDTVYFPEKTYLEEYDQWLSQHGYTIAMHHGETGRTLVVSESEEGIWHPGIVDWMAENRRIELSSAVDVGGNIVYAITLGKEDISYEMDYLDSMLTRVDSYCQEYSVQVVTAEAARDYHGEVEENRENLESAWTAEKENLEAQIEDLNRRILEIQDKYLTD